MSETDTNSEFQCGNCGAGIPDDHIGPQPSEAQVEAAAIVMFQQSAGLLLKWDTRPEYLQDSFRNDARAVLRAAGGAR